MASTATSANNATRHIFPFFELPKELRDIVYDESMVDKRVTLKNCLQVMGRNVAATALLTISRQFKEEYQDRASKQATLHLTDAQELRCRSSDQIQDMLPDVLTSVRSVHVNFIAHCFMLAEGEQEHGYVFCDWVKQLVKRLPLCRYLSLCINIYSDDRESAEELHSCLIKGGWMKLQYLEEVRIYAVEDYFDFDNKDFLRLQLSKQAGKMKVVHQQDVGVNGEQEKQDGNDQDG